MAVSKRRVQSAIDNMKVITDELEEKFAEEDDPAIALQLGGLAAILGTSITLAENFIELYDAHGKNLNI